MSIFRKDKLSIFQKRKIHRWKKIHGRQPNISNPCTFTEKLLARVLFSRDPYYNLYGTKINAPFFVQNNLPPSLKIIKRYGAYQEITPAILQQIPAKRFVVKSSWAGGHNQFISDIDKTDLQKVCKKFNRNILTQKKNALRIQDPYNCVIIEELIGNPESRLEDFKFHCIRNKQREPMIICQHYMQTGNVRLQCAYDTNFNKLDYSISTLSRYSDAIDKPERFDEALDIAKQLSKGFDYIRIDLYLLKEGVFFGEFTPYHSAGLTKVTSLPHDLILGEHWDFRLNSFQPSEAT